MSQERVVAFRYVTDLQINPLGSDHLQLPSFQTFACTDVFKYRNEATPDEVAAGTGVPGPVSERVYERAVPAKPEPGQSQRAGPVCKPCSSVFNPLPSDWPLK